MYKCPDCEEIRMVGFSCKSRFCSGCGKRYIDRWVEKQQERILNTSHRHVVFTLPKELRGYVYWNRDIIKELSDGANEVVTGYYKSKNKSREYKIGVITVVHTFGRDVGFNPHVHALIAEGGLDKYNQWKDITYISYEYLRKAWQKISLDIFKSYFKGNKKVQNLVRMLYNKYRKGFYVHAKPRMRSAKGAAKYIGRYLARPAIAEYRIIKYDGEKVKFWYKDHETEEIVELSLPVMQFIGRLVMHIPKKYFRLVRRYGLYRRGFNKRAQKIICLWRYMKKRQLRLIMKWKKVRSKKWRERIIDSFGEDPIKCKNCGREMILWEIWSPRYDFIYHVYHTDKNGRYIKKYPWKEDPRHERIKRARENGTTIPFPYKGRRMV
jgi:hypothetical protein